MLFLLIFMVGPCLVLGRFYSSELTIILMLDIIRIYHQCEGGIEISVSRITDWHHEAC